jgi:hypothetical protein
MALLKETSMLIPITSISDLQSIKLRKKNPTPHQIWPRSSAQLHNSIWETTGITPRLDLAYNCTGGTVALLAPGHRRRGEGRGQLALELGETRRGGLEGLSWS